MTDLVSHKSHRNIKTEKTLAVYLSVKSEAFKSGVMEMGCGLWATAGLVFMCYIAGGAEAYQNHTVGGAAGWSFDDQSNASATNYTNWANNQTFSLGDYLIFNTNYNHTVILTYNASTYDNCNYDDSQDSDTFVYLDVDPTKTDTNVTVSIPLISVGMNYFFSSAEDGIECLAGMRFEVNVSFGQGLPPSLMHPPPPPFSEPPLAPTSDSVIPQLSPPPPGHISGSQTIKAASLSAFVLFLSIVFGFV